jgi:hypothetical protein
MGYKMNNLEKLIEQEKAWIKGLRAEYKNVGGMLDMANKRLEQHLLEFNKDKFDSMEWLIKNPTLPGVHEALEKLFKEYYGGTYNGPHHAGYIHNGDYKPIQINIEFMLKDYDDGGDGEIHIKNCKHFVENYLQFFKPYEEIESRYSDKFPLMKVVGFQFQSESSGLRYLGYNPENENWYCYSMVYRTTDVVCKFKDFDEAIRFAYVKANIEENDDE